MNSTYKKVLAVVLSAVLLLAMTAIAYAGATLTDDAAEESTAFEAVTGVIDEEVTDYEEETDYSLEDTTDEDVTDVIEYVRLGDVNINGEVDINDARYALRYAIGLDNENLVGYKELRMNLADFNQNGVLKANDARLILRYALNLPVIFGAESGEPVTTEIAREYFESITFVLA